MKVVIYLSHTVKTYIISFLLLFYTTILILNSSAISSLVTSQINLWVKVVLPNLLPFFILSAFLIRYGIVSIISELLKPIGYILFGMSGHACFVFILSLISGFPSNAKYITDLVNKQKISANEGTRMLTFTHFPNPVFLLSGVGTYFLGDKKLGMFIFIIIVLTNTIIGIGTRFFCPKKKYEHINLKKALNEMHTASSNIKFLPTFEEILFNSINILLLILGIMILFSITAFMISSIINLNPLQTTIVSGGLEMVRGLNLLKELHVSTLMKIYITTAFISFGGASVHVQIASIIKKEELSYLPYLFSRIISIFITIILISLLKDPIFL